MGASVGANEAGGVRAGLCHDAHSACQGLEDDDMNVLCLGGRTLAMAWALHEELPRRRV